MKTAGVAWDDPRIFKLRSMANAAYDEFDEASACHEAWRPAAYDQVLHKRLGTSYATNTFKVIRQALRRETMLALLRLWDRDKNAVSLSRIADALEVTGVVDVFVDQCVRQWGYVDPGAVDHVLEDQKATVLEQLRQHELATGRRYGECVRGYATEAVTLIRSYESGGNRHLVLKHLRHLRNQHLAHRQVTCTPSGVPRANADDNAIERLYLDMAKVIHLLRLIIDNKDYNPEHTNKIRAQYAEHFWAGVCGERTELHPHYRRRTPPNLV